ncbi:MAG: Ig-like domain-containing protein [Planctomycetota bacterium]
MIPLSARAPRRQPPRSKANSRKRRSRRTASLRYETLEARRLLASDVNISPFNDPGTYSLVTTGGVSRFTPVAALVEIGEDVIEAELNAGNQVIVETTNAAFSEEGSITVVDLIEKTGGANTSLTLVASGSITLSTASIQASSGQLDVTLHSDSDSVDGGDVSVFGSTIETNGGDLIIGGGADPALNPAIGSGLREEGVVILGNLDSSGGNISIRGEGAATGGMGVSLSNATINGGNAGAITIIGTGGGGVDQQVGVSSDESSITSNDGGIVIEGSSAASGDENVGVLLLSSTLEDTGTGDINITGTSPDASTDAIRLIGDQLSFVTGGEALFIANTGSFSPNGVDLRAASTDVQGALSPGGDLTTDVFFENAIALLLPTVLRMQLNGDVPGTEHDQLSVEFLEVDQATLELSGSISSNPGQTITLVDIVAGDTDSLVSPFIGLPQGSTIPLNGLSFELDYFGGDGNDIVLTQVAGSSGPQVVDATSGDDDILVRVIDGSPNDVEVLVNGVVDRTFALSTTTSLTVNGLDGSDSLTVDYSFGDPVPSEGTFFNGGDPSNSPGDAMTLVGGSVQRVIHTFFNESDGEIDIDGSLITYMGLEPIVDSLNAVDREFDYQGGAETITLSDAATAGSLLIDSTLGESVAFTNPSGSLTVFTGDGVDTVNVPNLDSGFSASLIFDGDIDDGDSITIGDVTLDTAGNGRGLEIAEFESITLDGTTVSNNLASGAGGGILLENSFQPSVAVLSGVTVDQNTASGGFNSRGGGIFAFGTDLTIDSGSVISRNTAAGFGGGIFVENGSLTVDATSIASNTSSESGGGAYVEDSSLAITNSSVSGNRADGSDSGGGGVYVLGNAMETFQVSSTQFVSNLSNSGGGGLEIRDTPGSIDSVQFDTNRVLGGVLSNEGGGGAVFVYSSASLAPLVTLDDVSFTGNEAVAGGGLAAVNANLAITNGLFDQNVATNGGRGGAIGARSDSSFGSGISLVESTIQNNRAEGDGGGIGVSDVNLALQDSLVIGNGAGTTNPVPILGRAGGIGIQGIVAAPTLTLDRVTVASNTATGDGGGIGVIDSGIDFTNVTITDNTADDNGGGIFYSNANSATSNRVAFSTFADNGTPLFPNNIFASGESIDMLANLFTDGVGFYVGGFTFNSLGYNISNEARPGLTDPTDQTEITLPLLPLGDFGGLIPTRPVDDRTAIDLVPAALSPALDARGVPRTGASSDLADVGAVESFSVDDGFLATVGEESGAGSTPISLDRIVPFDVTLSHPGFDDDTLFSPAQTFDFLADTSDSVDFVFSIVDDEIVEPDEHRTVNYTSDRGPVFGPFDLVTVQDVDLSTITVSDPIVDEGDGSVELTITSSNAVDSGFTVDYRTFSVTALAPADYISEFSSLTFVGTAGESQLLSITLTDDAVAESDETFRVDTEGASGPTVDDSDRFVLIDSGVVTILDDDGDSGPMVSDGVLAVAEDDLDGETLDLNPLINDGSGPFTFTLSGVNGGAVRGFASIDANGILTYTPDPNENGLDTIAFTVEDANSLTDSGVVDVAISAVNDEPVADDDSAVINISLNTSVVVDVLANDTDVDGDTLMVVAVSDPTGGTVVIQGDEVLYTPDAATRGFDTFTYTISDGTVADTAVVTIDVTASASFLTLTTGAGDGEVTLLVDPFGNFGEGAIFDPAGPAEPGPAVFDSFVGVRVGTTGPRQRPESDNASATNFSGDSNEVVSEFTVLGLEVSLIQTLSPTLNTDQERIGGTLTQAFSFRNPTGDPITIDLARYLDADLDFDDSILDVGGLDQSSGELTLFTTEPGATGLGDRTFVGIRDSGGAAPAIGRYDVQEFSSLRSEILSGVPFGDMVLGDLNNDGLIDETQAYDVELALRRLLTIQPGESEVYSTETLFGGRPATASLGGHVYCDVNGNNTEEPGEEVANAFVFADLNRNGIADADEPSVLTDSMGDYQFDDLPVGIVDILLRVPDGCAGVPETFSVVETPTILGDIPRDLLVTDVDGDGDNDVVAVGDRDARFYVTPQGATTLSTGSRDVGDRPQAVDAWRASGSSAPASIAVASVGLGGGTGDVRVLVGDQETVIGDLGDGPIDVVIDDFNQDGLADIVTAAFRSDEFRIAFGSGQPTVPFLDSVQLAATEEMAFRVITGFFNSDGELDLALGSFGYTGTGQVDLLFGNGDGTFEQGPSFTTDGHLYDLAAVTSSQGGDLLIVLSGTPSREGSDAEGQLDVFDFRLDDSGGSLSSSHSSSLWGGKLRAGNVNDDGHTDLAIIRGGSEGIELLLGDGQGGFSLVRFANESENVVDAVFGDLDNSGRDSLLLARTMDPPSDDNPNASSNPTRLLRLELDRKQATLSADMPSPESLNFQPSTRLARLDVNGDEQITALDALTIINGLSGDVTRVNAEPIPDGGLLLTMRDTRDVNGDGRVSGLDALLVINHLNDINHRPSAKKREQALDLLMSGPAQLF